MRAVWESLRDFPSRPELRPSAMISCETQMGWNAVWALRCR